MSPPYRHLASLALAAALVLFALLGAPDAAEACSVCGPGAKDNRVAFIVTTAFMTAMPLLTVGGIVWWLRRRVLAQRAEAPIDA